MNITRFALLFIAVMQLQVTKAQLPNYRQYTTTNGLPSANVFAVLQDSEGYMWFGTENGVCRFDGNTFKTYTTKDGLTENLVIGIHQDKHGRIWFITLNGRLCYFYNGTIYNPSNNSFVAKLPACGSANSIIEDKLGTIYLAFMKEVLLISETTYTLIPVKRYIGFSLRVQKISNEVSLLCNKRVLFHSAQPFVFHLCNNLIEYKNGNFRYLSTPRSEIGINDFHFQTIIDNDLWYTTFQLGATCIKNYLKNNRNTEVYLPDVKVGRVYRDNEQNLWFGTVGKGVFMIPGQHRRTFHFNHRNRLDEDDIRTLYIDAGKTIWAGAIQNKLYALKNGRLKKYEIPSSIPDYLSETTDILQDKQGNLYVCNVGDLVRYKGEPIPQNADIIKEIMPDGKPVYGRNYKALTQDKYGNILAVNAYKCFSMSSKPADKNMMSKEYENGEKRMYTMYADSKGITWVADAAGLNVLSGNKLIPAFTNDSLLREPISRIRETPDGNLLLATKSKGLILFDGKNVKQVFNQKNGLASDICSRIFADKNNIWVGTSGGLGHLIYQNDSLALKRNYTTEDGILSDEINDVVVLDDTIYVASAEGLSILPVTAYTLSTPPPVYFNSIKYGNINLLDSATNQLRFNNTTIEFNFTGITFQQPDKVEYSYRLVGADDTWKQNYSGTIDYPALLPGNYSFEMKAKKVNSGWSPVKSFQFSIDAPFWMKNWFYVLVYSSLVSGVVLLVYYLSRRTRIQKLKKAELQNRLVQLEQQALSALMNPHFIFNSLNSIQQFLHQNDTLSANKYLSLFAKLTRTNMEAVMKTSVTLEDELERLKLYLHFEKLRFGDKLNYEIVVPDEMNTDEIVLPPMILQPFVENAIWHGILPTKETGNVSIHINQLSNELIQIRVEDDGIGIKNEYLNQNILLNNPDNHALSITAQRLRLINITSNHRLYIRFSHKSSNALRKGTLAEIILPVSC